MIGFLAPALLALGLAAAVPLVLHLLQRHQGPRVVFPALRYLRRAERESARRVRLRQILLLAVRVAALLLLALAAARPFLAVGGSEHPPTAVVIVLDNSLSTGLVEGDRRVLDGLKQRALATLRAATPDDRFWVIRAAQPWEPAAPGGAAEAMEAVGRTEGVAAAADLGKAIARARDLLASGREGLPAEIHVLSDLQATALPDPLPPVADAAPGVLIWAPGGAPPDNAGVVHVEVGGGLAPRIGQRTAVSARVAGTADSVDLRVMVGGALRAAGRAAADGPVLLALPPLPGGRVEGWVEKDADALRGDDRRHFVVEVAPPPAVAMGAPSPYIEEALAVLAGAGRIARDGVERPAVVVAPAAAGAQRLSDTTAVVVLPPESPLELPAVNRRLAAAGIPWRFQPPDAAGEARPDTAGADADLAPLLESARLAVTYPLQPEGAGAAEDTVLIALRDGDPWVVRGRRPSGGRYLLVGSPLTPEAGTVASSAAMVPLVERLVGSWAAEAQDAPEVLTGHAFLLPGRARTVLGPDGAEESVEGGAPYRPGAVGVYRVRGSEGELAAFAANAPSQETPLDRLGRRDLRERLPGWTVRLAESPGEWEALAYRVRRGGEAWRWAVILALALLLAELALSGSRRRTSRAAAPAEATREEAWRTSA